MEFSRRLDLFGPEIFAALNDKKVALEAEGRHLYNLSVGTPDFAPADYLKQALIDAAQDNENWKYSLRDLPEMLEAVCGYYKRRFNVDTITPDEVMSFSGSQDGIGHLGLALCNDGDLVLLPDPCYPVFMTGSKLGGAEPWYYKLTKENHFLPDVTSIPEDVARRAKLMLVSLPANPVGSIGTPELYAEIVDFCRKYDILLVHDNAYSDIIFDGAHGGSIFNTPGAGDMRSGVLLFEQELQRHGRAHQLFGGAARCHRRLQKAAHPDRFRYVPAHSEGRHRCPDRPAGRRAAPVRRVPAPPRRPVRRSARHRLECARQPRQHVCLGPGARRVTRRAWNSAWP